MVTRKIYTNTIAQIAGKIITAGISIFLIKILTNYLDTAGYGLYSKIYNYLSIFAVIADMGLYTITVRELTKHQNNPDIMEKIAGNVLTLRTISGIMIIVLAVLIAPFLSGYNSQLALISIVIVGFFTLLGLINSSLMSSLQAMLKTEFSLIAITSGKLLTFLLTIGLAYWWLPLEETSLDIRIISIFTAGLAGNIFMTLLTWWYTKRHIVVRWCWDTTIIVPLLRETLPYGIALFLGVIFFKVDVILLSLFEPQNIADEIIAIYSLPMKIVEVGMMYGTIFLNSFLPVLTSHVEAKNTQEARKLTKKGFELLFGFGAGISLFLMFFAREVLLLISNENFVETLFYGYSAVHAMRIVAWIFLFYFIASLSNYILIAQGDQKKLLFVNGFLAIVNIVGNSIIIPYYSFVGSAIVTLISQILLAIIMWYLTRKMYDSREQIFTIFTLSTWAILAGTVAIESTNSITTFGNTPVMQAFWTLVFGGSIFGAIYISGWIGTNLLVRQIQKVQ